MEDEGMDIYKLAEALRALDEASPIKTRIVSSEAEFDVVVAEMKGNGLRIACSSSAGLPEPKQRITFLPESAFTREPPPEGDEVITYRKGAPVTRRPARDVREFLAELETESRRQAAAPAGERSDG